VCCLSCLTALLYITNGTRQGGVLSSYLFSRYIRGMIHNNASCHIGYNIGDMASNILAYADDIVLLSPSWRGLQYLIDRLLLCAEDINMTCTDRKTVYMVFSPCNRSRIIRSSFPVFKLGTSNLQCIPSFRYLGHIITEPHLMTFNGRSRTLLYLSTFWFANLINARIVWSVCCSRHTAYLCMTLHCGNILLHALALTTSCLAIKSFLPARRVA